MSDTLRDLGWDEDWAALFEGIGPSQGEPARVTAQQRDRWTIHPSTGPRPARLLACGDGRAP